MNTSNSMLATLVQFFQEEDWQFSYAEDDTSLNLRYQGHTESWWCLAQARETSQQFVFYSIVPLAVPEQKRQAVLEFLTRANFGLIMGNFEMDLDEGAIRFKTSVDVEGNMLNAALIKQMVQANLTSMDTYLPGIKSILDGTLTPQAALAQIEAML